MPQRMRKLSGVVRKVGKSNLAIGLDTGDVELENHLASDSKVDKRTKISKLRENVQSKWKGIKAIFRSNSLDEIEISTLTIPRLNPLSTDESYLCDDCQLEVSNYGRRSLGPTRLCFRSIHVGKDSPVILRELIPCERCSPPEDMKYHRFEASSNEILKIKKKMSSIPKDVDWLQEFARIEVEKTKGRCTIRSNKQLIIKS